jgi:hypothetical protein
MWGAYKNLTSLGDGIDSINNPREIPQNGEQQTDPKLHLMNHNQNQNQNHPK